MASILVLRKELRPIGAVGGGGGGGGGGLKLSVPIEAYLQPCIADNLIRTCIGEDDCQKHRKYEQQRRHECSELTVSIGIDICKDARRAHLWQQLNEVTVVPTLLPPVHDVIFK